MPRVVEYFG